ncbi:hypothetical protein PCASD_10609 [Puccinia coronata f. sp. avenae]|uniref:Uncharacterized protein n=1 Tax=Puccinia coronata f. sp. avenae TaxID=200324 RepID=A0A2N5U9K6_9BASI|nr:hypothetical protein PCASD_10609 [Puccinia coronata f. sp. avenae]
MSNPTNPILPRNMCAPFAKSLASTSCVPLRASSRASQVSNIDARSSDLDDVALNIGDGTQCLEDIFNDVTAGTTGPSLAEETFRATQQQQRRCVLPSPNPFMKWAAHGRPCGPEPGGHPWAAHGPLVGLTQPPEGSLAGGLGRPAQPINSCGPLRPGHLSVFPANGSPNPAQTQQGLGGPMGALPDSHP